MKFSLDSNEINLKAEKQGLRLTSKAGDNLLLANVSEEETEDMVRKNYACVKEFYSQKASAEIQATDLEAVSLKIVLHYFYMYQLWRSIYEKEKNRSLAFLSGDFDHPGTADEIISYFKGKYRRNYRAKCAAMLGMNAEEFSRYEKGREDFSGWR